MLLFVLSLDPSQLDSSVPDLLSLLSIGHTHAHAYTHVHTRERKKDPDGISHNGKKSRSEALSALFLLP